MINSAIQYVKSYSRVSSIIGKISAIGVMGYGIKQLWSEEAVKRESFGVRASLSALYLLHMGSVSLTIGVLFGSIDIPPSIATAIVSATALIKGSGELLKEYLDNAALKKQHAIAQNQLNAKNVDFQRALSISEVFNEREVEIALLEAELDTIKKKYAKRSVRRNHSLTKKWEFLTSYVRENRNKRQVIGSFFEKIDIETYDISQGMREIKERIAFLRQQSSISSEHESELDNLGLLDHQCIKYEKVKKSIEKLVEIKNNGNSYIDKLINEQKQKLQSWKTLKDKRDYINDASILGIDVQTFLKMGKKANPFLKSQYEKLIQDTEDRIKLLRQKQNEFKRMGSSAHHLVDNDFASMFNDMKSIIDLQNQISIASFNESSKEKNVNFSMLISLAALLMCVIPSGEFEKVLNPLMLSFGVAAGTSSSIDFYKKYLLKSKLLSSEDKKLKRYIQDNTFHTLATISNPELRQRLVDKLNSVLESTNEDEQKHALRPTRLAKEKAKVLLVSKRKPRVEAQTMSAPVIDSRSQLSASF